MEFYNLTTAQATAFKKHVVAREPYMLRELALWMEETGGPIELMDASFDSLVPLWEWYVDLARADFLGLTDGLIPSASPELTQAPPEPEWTREYEIGRQSAVGGDRLMHYARLVLTRLVPDAYWDVYAPKAGPVEDVRNQTALFLPGWRHRQRREFEYPSFLGGLCVLASGALHEGDFGSDRLRRAVTASTPRELVPRRQERQVSVMTPFLHVDLPPIPELARVTPALAWLDNPPPVSVIRDPDRAGARGGGDWEEMVLAKGPALGLDDEPWLLRPLPLDRVAAALTAGGFHDDGRTVTPDALLGDSHQFTHDENAAVVNIAVHDRTLRALQVEPVDPTAQTWQRAIAPLRALAADLGARFAPEDEFLDEDERDD